MSEYACSTDLLFDAFPPESANAGNFSPSSSGTFALRRAHYLKEAAKSQITPEQQLELIKLFRKGDAGAKRKMIALHMQLVLDVTKRNANRGVTLLDLVMEGNQGLIHALENYEPHEAVSFSEYATACIGQSIERAIADQHDTFSRCVSKLSVVPHAAT
jgi:DNA-directed RNA polymerase sigma subunit (sigma70/sigma32)